MFGAQAIAKLNTAEGNFFLPGNGLVISDVSENSILVFK